MNFEPLESMNKDHLLRLLGLQERRSYSAVLAPALGVFGVGLLVGATLGLLAAPRPGRELRNDLARRVKGAPSAVAKLPERATEAYHWMTDKADVDREDHQEVNS
jgi:hypothetical protein